MWIQLPRPLFSLTKGLCFGAPSHLALIISHKGSSLTTTLGYLLWQIWEGAWKKGWFEERGDEVDSPPPPFFFFDKCIGFPQSSSKPEYDIPLATDGNDFWVAIFLDWTIAYFRSLQSLLKEGRKKAQLWIFPGPCGWKLPVLLLRRPLPVGQPGQTCFLFPFRPILEQIFPHKTYNCCSSSLVWKAKLLKSVGLN